CWLHDEARASLSSICSRAVWYLGPLDDAPMIEPSPESPPRGALEPSTWLFSLPSWVVQDGVYPEVAAGDPLEFALEVPPETSLFWEAPSTHCEHIQHARYVVSGKAVVCRPDLWVIDFGIRAYHRGAAPDGLAPGQPWTGRVALGVDPFHYKEELHALPGVP